MNKSPFYVVEEFLSPMLCEDILLKADFTVPNTDKNGAEVMTMKSCQPADLIIFERLQNIIDDVQAYYQVLYKGTEAMKYEWFPEGSVGAIGCENSVYSRKKWLRVKPADLTGIIFLTDYQDQPNFDEGYEVYGGKLEFPQHQFGFNPKRGTLIIFPSGPHFINQTTLIQAGDLHQVRFNIVGKTPYLYNPAGFPGNYTNWF